MSSLPKWIQEIKNRADKATPGPWEATNKGVFRGSVWVSENSTPENAQFAAHARDDVPVLIELVEEMARALEGTEIPLRLASDALYKTDKHDLFRETAQAQFQVQAMLRKYRGEDEDG